MQMFRFIKKGFFTGLTILWSINPLSATLLKCVSMNIEDCRTRLQMINVNSNEPAFYPYSVEINKCTNSCNNIKNPDTKLCVPDVVKDIDTKVFNLISIPDEIRHIKWHETCEWECRLDASVCNNEQRWNKDKCRCECKKFFDKGICNEGFI